MHPLPTAVRPASRTSPPGFGLGLAPYELAALKNNAIFTNSRVVAVRQSSGRQLLRGEESGGAGPTVGHYVGYVPLDGYPFQVVQPVPALAPGAQHRRVFGTVLVRFEVFHYSANQVHTQISLHTVAANTNPTQHGPETHVRRVLFEARFGEIAEDNTPAFLSPAGELLAVPSFLTEGFRQALNGSRCRTCRHRSHLEKVAPIVLPPGLLQTLRLPVAHSTPAEK